MFSRERISIFVRCSVLFFVVLALAWAGAQKTEAQTEDTIYLPMILLPPESPYLQPIEGYDNNHSYTVNWSLTDASLYILQEATTANFSDAIEVYQGPDTWWTTPSMKSSGTFFYRVASSNEFGTSSWSNVQSIIVNPPIAPTLSTIVDPDQDHSYTVAWSNTNAIYYVLQEATTSNFSNAKAVYQGGEISWTTPAWKTAGTYFYRVAAVYSYGGSYWGNAKSITIQPPKSPTLIAISNPDKNYIYSVTWSNTSATEYRLQEATRADFSDAKLVYNGAGLSWTTPTGKTPGTYYYRVAAIYSYGGSLWSNVKTVTITPPPTPIPSGEIVHFKGWLKDIQLTGKVISSDFQTSLIPDYGDPVNPSGVFVVVIMDVTNMGLESDEPGMYNSFKVKDSIGRLFDMADVEAQLAAGDQYNLPSVYQAIQPGFTRRMIFVFDVLPQSTGMHLVSMSPW